MSNKLASICCLIIFISSCTDSQVNDSKSINIDSTKNSKTSILEKENNSTIELAFKNPINIDSFFKFTNIDLLSSVGGLTFKKKQNILYKPQEKGYYFYAYWFSEIGKTVIKINGSEKQNYLPYKYFDILVYKFGKDTKEFNQQKSCLIFLYSEIKNKSLGRLNLVGKNLVNLKSSSDKEFDKFENKIIFNKNDMYLSFQVDKKNTILSVLFARLNVKYDRSIINEIYDKYNYSGV